MLMMSASRNAQPCVLVEISLLMTLSSLSSATPTVVLAERRFLSEERHQQQTAVHCRLVKRAQRWFADIKGMRKDVLVWDVSDVCAQSLDRG